MDPRIPFGGARQAGYGLEFGIEGIKARGVPQPINGQGMRRAGRRGILP